MQFRQGRNFGRVLHFKFDDQDDLREELKGLAKKERVKATTFPLLGSMRTARLVSGPRQAVIPPEPLWTKFRDGREVVGIGSHFCQDAGAAIYLNRAIGRGKETLVGCLRKDSTVYLVVEVVIVEIAGIDAHQFVNRGRASPCGAGIRQP